ncbi:general secretion pathway protein GspK, partial [bacterium]|nr:general secretion pathway protein GspK [bacterium]
VEGADNLDNYLTSYGLSYPKININTASRVLLRCLTDDMTEQDVDNIMEHRPIKDSYELDSIIGADTKKVYEMKKFVDYTSKYFQIKANAVYDEESIVIRTVVDKSGTIVYWGVE